jgi:hypothetical protein
MNETVIFKSEGREADEITRVIKEAGLTASLFK